MRFSILALFVVAPATLFAAVSAQYPLEECHWECDIVLCDYYGEHCDYDCYEVCYPYARSLTGGRQKVNNRYRQQQRASSIGKSHREGLSSSTTTDSKVVVVPSDHREPDQSQIGDKEIKDYDGDVEVSSSTNNISNDSNNNQQQQRHQSSSPTKHLEFEPPINARKAPLSTTTPVSNG